MRVSLVLWFSSGAFDEKPIPLHTCKVLQQAIDLQMSNKSNDPNRLRAEAEAQLAHSSATESVLLSNQKLLHELQIHQVQLEMQNEELRHMQLAMEESRDRYADLYNQAPVAYLTLTHAGLIDSFNFTAQELFGSEPSALLARRFAALVAPIDGDRWHVFFAKAIKHNRRVSIELTLKTANASEFPAKLDCVYVNSMLRITLVDLTQTKLTEVALQQAKTLDLLDAERTKTAKVQQEALSRLQKITNQLPGMVFQYCLHGDGSSHCLYVSDAIHDLFGLSPEDVYEDAIKLFSVIHPDDYDGFITALQKSTLDLSPFSPEYRVKLADGTVRWLLGNALPERNANGSTLWHGFFTDITERKYQDQLLQQRNVDLEIATSAAEEANLAKSVFLSRMSHELRTPLNAILGYAQLLEAGTPPLTETQHKRLTPIIKSGWYLLQLINEILDLDAIESGNLGLSPEALSVQDVLLECQVLVQVQADKESIQLDFISCDSAWSVYVDKTRIKQVLLNLLSNAIKYNREQGRVTVQCHQTSGHIHICIKDNGEGMSAEQLAQLFKPFNRLGQENGYKQGTGIGLVVTKALVEQMGGSISVESTVGVGSEFHVKLLRNDRWI